MIINKNLKGVTTFSMEDRFQINLICRLSIGLHRNDDQKYKLKIEKQFYERSFFAQNYFEHYINGDAQER